MNNTITFPPAEPTLKLARPAEKWAATLAEERLRLQEDQEILRAREQNLREYENRLRTLQAEIEAGRAAVAQPTTGSRYISPVVPRTSSGTPFLEDPALTAAWEKLHRARELMDAELKNLRDERIAIREMETQVRRRDEVMTARETLLAQREALTPVEATEETAAAPAQSKSAVSRFTLAPFNMAMAVIRGKK
jgi:hypothetical protein